MNVSRLVLGTVQFGLNYGVANTTGKPSFQTVKKILKCALDSGITTLDTAAAYGDSETVLGNALRELGITGKMTLISKIPPVPAECDPERFLENSLKQSLRNLRIEVLPLALFHREQDLRHLPVLKRMIGKGWILGAGGSLDSSAGIPEAEKADCLQVPCNVMDHRFDQLIRSRRGGMFLRSVYLPGLLLMEESRIAPSLAPLIPYRRKLESLGMPLKELCMRYLLTLPGSPSVLTGVDTPEQLRENLRLAAPGALPEDLFRAAASAVPLLEETLIRPSL